jgi:RNA polymerase primary sigma factor
MQELTRDIMIASDALAQVIQKEPNLDELSYYLKLQPQQVQNALNLPLANSLEIEISEDGQDQLKDFLADPNQNTPNAAEKIILNQKVRSAVDKLPERERILIQLRFGLFDGYAKTLEQVSKHFQFTRERARQIESQALSKLHQILANESGLL